MPTIFKRQADIDSAVRRERNNRSSRAFSISRVIGSMVDQGGRLDGYELEVIQEITRANRSWFDHKRVPLPIELLADPTISLDNLVRDMSAGSNSAGGYLTHTSTSGVQEIMRPWSVVVKAGATVIPGDTAGGMAHSLIVPKVTSDMTAYWLSSESASITQSDPALGTVTMTPKSGAALTKFSRLLAKQGNVSDALLQRHMLQVVGRLFDTAAIAGTGSAGQPLGISNTPGLSSSLAFDYGAGLLAELNSQKDGNLDGFGFLTSPYVRYKTKHDLYGAMQTDVWKTDPSGDKFFGWPSYISNDCPVGVAVAGPWSDCLVAMWGAPILELNPFDNSDFKAGKIQARMILDCDVSLLHPEAWMKFTNLVDLSSITPV